MNHERFKELLAQRKEFNNKIDLELLAVCGFPTDAGVKVGISMDDVGVESGADFARLPDVDVLPNLGLYVLDPLLNTSSFQIEVVEVDKDFMVKVHWERDNVQHVFRLPAVVFNAIFMPYDDFSS